MSTLCDTFQDLARTIGRMLPESYQFRVRIGEETLTDLLLFTLIKSHSSQVAVHKFTRHGERKSGADWEWALGGRQGWFVMRVQAKKLNPETGRFEDLIRYRGNQRTRQVNALIRQAHAENSHPVYCFYATRIDGVPHSSPCTCNPSIDLLGCMFADAVLVRELVLRKQNSLDAIAAIAFPMHCLVCCTADMTDLAHRARSISIRLRKSELPAAPPGSLRPDIRVPPPRVQRTRETNDQMSQEAGIPVWSDAVRPFSIGSEIDPSADIPPVQKEPPPYVEAIWQAAEGKREQVLDVICEKRELAGLVVVSEA